MRLAGVNIPDDCVLELVRRLRRAELMPQADTIEGALVTAQGEVSLTIPDRVALLAALEDPPATLEELRAVLAGKRLRGVDDALS